MPSVRTAPVLWLACLIAGLAFVGSGSAQSDAKPDLKPLADRPEYEGVEVYKQCLNSSIYVIDLNSGLGQGSGFVVDVKKKLAVTNYHVVGDSEFVIVSFPLFNEKNELIVDRRHYMEQVRKGKGIRAKVLKTTQQKDLAILQLESLPPNTKAFPLADRLPKSGDNTFTIGNAGAVNGVFGFTRGIVRNYGIMKSLIGGGGEDFTIEAEVIQATNAISPGDSGGPLIDRYGQVVGVNQSGRGKEVQLVQTFISVNEVKKFLKDNGHYIESPKPPTGAQSVGAQLYEKCIRGCVFIMNTNSMGSGFLVDAQKKIVITNYHVVDDAPIVQIMLPMWDKNGQIINEKSKYVDNVASGLSMRGKVLHRDKTRDLAIVELQDSLPAGTKEVALARRTPDIGSPVYTIGNAGAINRLYGITEGYVRVKGPLQLLVGGGDEVLNIQTEMIQASNPINQGDSGGPLFNDNGEVVGVNQSGNFRAQNINNFVSVVEVARYLNENGFSVGEAAAKAHLEEHKKSSTTSHVEGVEVYKKALNFAIFIFNDHGDGKASLGSGFLVNSGDRIAVTNHHVVGKSPFVKVQFPAFDKQGRLVSDKKFYMENVKNNRAINAKVIHSDPARDIAIIQLAGPLPERVRPIVLADDVPPTGSAVYTIGNAGDVRLNFGFTRGEVRTVGMNEFVTGGGDLKESFRVTSHIIQSSNPINPGDSGGPLMNGNAELIGINQSLTGNVQNVVSFISVREVRKYLKERSVGIPKTEPKTELVSKEPKKEPGKEGAVVPPTTTVTPEQETKAASALRSAKTLFKNDNDSDAFVAALAKIVKMYPGTKAAVEAQGAMREFKR
jgi:S1-C subfamily serine protease